MEDERPEGEVELGTIAEVSASDRLEILLMDDHEGSRVIDLWFHDRRPSEPAELVAEVTCSDSEHRQRALPLFETTPNTAIGPVKLLECSTDDEGMRVVVDIGDLTGEETYVVVPVIWIPSTPSGGFMTASWVFMIPPAITG